MKKKLIEVLKWTGLIATLLCISFINTLLLKNEMFMVCCVLMGDIVICVMVMNICEETFKGMIKFSKKRWRKSENGI